MPRSPRRPTSQPRVVGGVDLAFRFVGRREGSGSAGRSAARLGLLVLLLAAVFGARCSFGGHDTSAQAARYDRFPVVPGAIERSDSTYEVRGDSGATGTYGRKRVYELPADLTAAEVMAFLRAHMPEGWTEPTDATCVRQLTTLPVPPGGTGGPPAPIPDGVGLLWTQSQLTVFAPGEDGPVLGERDGVDGFTFELSRDGETKLLTLDLPDFSCGVPQPDRQAEEFDNGPSPIKVVPTIPYPPG
jgi:hypothetical protein